MSKFDINNYMNSLLADVLKSFYDERGRGCRYRLTMVGVNFFKDFMNDIRGSKDIDEIMSNIIRYIKENHLATDISWNLIYETAQYIELKIDGCINKGVCEIIASRGIETLMCPTANWVMHNIENTLGMTSEFASTEHEGKHCCSKVVFFNPSL